MKARKKPDADCQCGGPIMITRRKNGASYFYCCNYECDFYKLVFRCYGSPIDEDLKDDLIHETQMDRAEWEYRKKK